MAVKNGIYKVDDGQGGFDEIDLKTNAGQVFYKNGKSIQELFDKKTKLWEGSLYLGENDVARLSKPLAECVNGIVLIFSDYDPGMANKIGNNFNWVACFIPKFGSFINSGNFYCPVPIMDNSAQNDNIVVKTIYVEPDRILGSPDGNKDRDGKDTVLREIWEV